MRLFVTGYRLLFGLLTLYAVVYLAVTGNNLANHFSFFTILCNTFGGIVLVWGAFRPVPDMVRGAATLFLALTGIVFALLLTEFDLLLPAWANTVLHQVLPVVMVVDWMLVPPKPPFSVVRSLWWLLFPLAYVTYTLIRGAIVDWYPYPFLDPRVEGYAHVTRMSFGIAIGFTLGALALAWIGDALGRRAAVNHV